MIIPGRTDRHGHFRDRKVSSVRLQGASQEVCSLEVAQE